jgi:predicted transcriptional regulator
MTTLRIGIRSHEEAKARLLAVARGHAKRAKNEPTVWLSSLASLAQLLNDENMALLGVIREGKPASLTELAQMTGRSLPSLSRTLARMEEYGLVRMVDEGRAKSPRLTFDRLEIVVDPLSGEKVAA